MRFWLSSPKLEFLLVLMDSLTMPQSLFSWITQCSTAINLKGLLMRSLIIPPFSELWSKRGISGLRVTPCSKWSKSLKRSKRRWKVRTLPPLAKYMKESTSLKMSCTRSKPFLRRTKEMSKQRWMKLENYMNFLMQCLTRRSFLWDRNLGSCGWKMEIERQDMSCLTRKKSPKDFAFH